MKIYPFLWFEHDAEEAVKLYTSLFKDSKIFETVRYGDSGPGAPGSVMTITFQIAGQDFIALNGGNYVKFNDAVSFHITVETQTEVDDLWEKLTANGGEPGQCGWLKDRFGLSWQIVPEVLSRLLQDADAEKTNRVTQAMLKMNKLDIAALQAAYDHA